MILRKPTDIDRRTVTQEIRQILGPELDADIRSFRRIQLMVPGSPTVWTWVTKTPTEDVSKRVGLNRGTYTGPVMTPATSITFHLLPGQTLWAAAEEGTAELTIIVEYDYMGA